MQWRRNPVIKFLGAGALIIVLAALFLNFSPMASGGCHPTVVEPASSWPAGTRLAISCADQSGVNQIYSVPLDGTAITQLTHNPFGSAFPEWSPDGKSIAYVAHGGAQIRIMNADGSNDRALTNPDSNDAAVGVAPRWSPDGGLIAYTYGMRKSSDPVAWPTTHIWLMRPDGSGKKQISDGNSSELGSAWSADGGFIVFASNRAEGTFHLWRMRSDGSGIVALTTPAIDQATGFPVEQKVPAWSPDGKLIAYWSGVEQSHIRREVLLSKGKVPPSDADLAVARTWHIHIMSPDGSQQRELAGGDDPAWTPDGRGVFFPASNNNAFQPGVGVIGFDGKDQRLLITTGGAAPAGYSMYAPQD